MPIPKSKILVSACLYGFCCRYDGKSNLLKDKTFLALKNAGLLVLSVFMFKQEKGAILSDNSINPN